MEFTLHYRGPLKAATGRNKRKDHKHDLRRHFHKQLKELWKLPQLSEFRDSLIVPEPDAVETRTLLRRVGQYYFAPLIRSYFHLVASLDIVMLRPEPEGRNNTYIYALVCPVSNEVRYIGKSDRTYEHLNSTLPG